jgi:hypothetical protein
MVVPVTTEGGFQPGQGYIRHESAEQIAQIVGDLLRSGLIEEDIRVITPFRAQRRLIRSELGEIGSSVPVTTVHRAQGSERKVVIFDPVFGAGDFLNCEEGFRLINVAFSRAQGKLIVLLSQGDSVNPMLGVIHIGPVGHPLFCMIPAQDARSLRGLTFGYLGKVYRCTSFSGDRLHLHRLAGPLQTFTIDAMVQRCGDPSRCPRGCNPNQDPFSRCI